MIIFYTFIIYYLICSNNLLEFEKHNYNGLYNNNNFFVKTDIQKKNKNKTTQSIIYFFIIDIWYFKQDC